MPETATQSEPFLLAERREGVLTLTLNRPRVLNSITREMCTALLKELRGAEKDPSIRVVVLTGAGRAFSAGGDLESLKENTAAGTVPSLGAELRRYYIPVVLQIRRMEKPVIAAVNGTAAGAGASLALACDIKICSATAKFISAFIQIGLVPAVGFTHQLTRAMGLGLALEYAWTAKPIPAREAAQFGLVNKVVPSDELGKTVKELVVKLLKAPPKALALTKRALNHAAHADFDSCLEYEANLQDILGRTQDHIEGVHAFLENRPAKFTGE